MADNTNATTNTQTHAIINGVQSDLPAKYNPDPAVAKAREAARQASKGTVAPPNPQSVKWARKGK